MSTPVPLPHGFVALYEGRRQILVREDAGEDVPGLLRKWAEGRLPPARKLGGGRGGSLALDLSPDLSVVLRQCRRGGLPARFNRDLYFGRRPRPFREVQVTEALRARGVPTVEILGAAVLWVLPVCYRGAVVSREVAGAINLWEYLRSVDVPERERVCRDVAAVTRLLHDVGAVHPDLNLQNYLVRRREGGTDVLIIDCDGVDLRPVSPADRRAAFDRICRSIQRLDPVATVLTLACIEALHEITRK